MTTPASIVGNRASQYEPSPMAPSAETPMQRVERLVKLVAAADVQVLITGPRGPGARAVAEQIHRQSSRASATFAHVTTSKIDDLDAALFGVLDANDGGTVLLEDVAELAPPTQARLRAYLERGSAVRLIAATSRELAQLVASGAFDAELSAKLGGITIELPSRRQRLRTELATFERQRIIDALAQCAGNQTRAAKLLGISRRTLVSRLDEYELPRPRGGGR